MVGEAVFFVMEPVLILYFYLYFFCVGFIFGYNSMLSGLLLNLHKSETDVIRCKKRSQGNSHEGIY